VGSLLSGAAPQFLASDDCFLVLHHVLAAEIEVLDVERTVGWFSMFAGDLVVKMWDVVD
jgi:hypothetical protein